MTRRSRPEAAPTKTAPAKTARTKRRAATRKAAAARTASKARPAVGLIVGSGLAHLGLPLPSAAPAETPYGPTSSALAGAAVGGRAVWCIARHGAACSIAPHAVNYRANVWALHAAGVRWCVAVNVVGAIAPGFAPGGLAIPDQIIDYTAGRAATFTAPGEAVKHVEFTEPFDPELLGHIAAAAADCGLAVRRGVYGVTQGPRLETAAEIDRLERDGCAMVGMTGMPEAVLARELGLSYAICAAAVNYAAGRAPQGASIHAELNRHMAVAMSRVARLLEVLIPRLHDAAM
jgi:5'-methylthioinosine phosphorylase